MNSPIKVVHDALTLRRTYRAVFGTPDGQRVLRDICKASCVISSAYTAANPNQTAYDNGARDLALGILRTLYRSDEDLHLQIAQFYKEQNEQPIEI